MAQSNYTLSDIRHPDLLYDSQQWTLWRDTFEGGDLYLDRYLEYFSDRETAEDFAARKRLTPIPSFAKAAILDIRNSIFQRLQDVSRVGGSNEFQRAANGEKFGVDRKGTSMDSFIGINVLTELLVMGQVGIYVDAPNKLPTTLAEGEATPYLYCYRIEDVLSFTEEAQEEPGQFKAVLLRDQVIDMKRLNPGVELPTGRIRRRRLVWKDDVDRLVKCRMWNEDTGEPIITENSAPDGTIILGVPFVPFILPTIGDSLLKEAAWYQKALLNLVSSDVDYALRSNRPFLTIQQELRTAGSHLKKTGTGAEPGQQGGQDQTEYIGSGVGRYYDRDLDRPGYIAPPTDPLETSMKLQEKLEDDIRKLINLAVANKIGSRTESAEAKKLSSQGLEAGLSFIGEVLNDAEQRVAHMWALYESRDKPKVAKIGYPTRYILKEDKQRIEDANNLVKLMDRMPSVEAKKVAAKEIVLILFGGRESVETIDQILNEIDTAGYTTSDVQSVLQAHKAALVSDETASEALGYAPGEVAKAREDRVIRATAILAAQTTPGQPGGIQNPASRGVPELDTGKQTASEEQAAGKEKAEEERELETNEEED